MIKVILKKDKVDKIRNFYPNVYRDEIAYIQGEEINGDVAQVLTPDGEFIAVGYITTGTNAMVRVLSTNDIKIDKKFFLEKIKYAYEKRKYLLAETNSIRAFFSEADGIPGLILSH